MNQTRANYQQFINDIYTAQKHVLGLVTKLAQRMDELEARLRAIKDDQNLHLSAIKNSLDELRGEIKHQYTEEAEEIDELNDVLAGELENLDLMAPLVSENMSSMTSDQNTLCISHNTGNTSLYDGQMTDLEKLVAPNTSERDSQPIQDALIL